MWKVMMVGQFIYGIGQASIGPFGVSAKEMMETNRNESRIYLAIPDSLLFQISYISEAAYRHNTPLYLGALFMLAIMGPAIGYMLGSGIIKIWVEFDRYETSLTPEDPR